MSQDDPKFDARQYAMLMYCSYKGDMTLWNEWRMSHPTEKIALSGASLHGAYLKGGNFNQANFSKANFESANLHGAELLLADLRGARLCKANLSELNVWGTNLQQANLQEADLRQSFFVGSNFKGTILNGACLQNASLLDCDLREALLHGTNLIDGKFCFTSVDSGTKLFFCSIGSGTDFTGVALGSAVIEPRLRVSLKNIIRKKQWLSWLKEGNRAERLLKWLTVKLFWAMSDYGRSTKRIAGCFLALSLCFAMIYLGCGYYDLLHNNGKAVSFGIVNGLFTKDISLENAQWGLLSLRSLYFSIVTMTTLGFGDMHAMPDSWLGHILLMLQVLLGYIMLGALITRFAVMFSDTGPAQPYEKGDSE